MSVLLQTSLGNLVIDLHTDVAPIESKNFLKLCKAKYYTFTPFYNVQRDYLTELGDPLYPISKEGRSAWNLADPSRSKYFETSKNKLHNSRKGSVAFVTKRSNDTLYASSIFTINLIDLDQRSSRSNSVVFGKVAEGFDVLDKINDTIVDEEFRPLQDIRIHHTYILEDPFEDIENLNIPENTPEPTEEQLSTIRLDDIINLEEEDIEYDEEKLKERKQREIETKALTLEIIGDLPSADVKPMENVLFVCKLNRVTKDDDLKVIFSRFGKILSCEIIKDNETGDSLQYAFIEYEEKRSCEAAYFKMDGALVDDRRIHVDFSQSVSKLANAWKSKMESMNKSRIPAKDRYRNHRRDYSPSYHRRDQGDNHRDGFGYRYSSSGAFERQ